MKIKIFFIALFITGSYLCFASTIEPIPEFSKDDRVLIFAPHPDDESIGAGGVIQKALKAGAAVKIVCFTNGDHNELAFIVYEKRLTFRKREFIHMGELRTKETIRAMQSLGLKAEDVVFLGYPDFGTLHIFTKFWGDAKPYRDFLTRIKKVPYSICLSPKADYVGENILKDLETVVTGFSPTKIFVSHPVDTNRDHRSLYLFLRIALWNLEDKIKQPELYPYLIHAINWPEPRGYHPELRIDPPKELSDSSIKWKELELTETEIKAKHDAISFYETQIEYNPPYLLTFARKNELFGDYPFIFLEETNGEDIKWHDLDTDSDNEEVTDLVYARKDNYLILKVVFKGKIDKYFGVNAYIFGYSKKTDFAKMPKININSGFRGVKVRDRKRLINIENLNVKYEEKSVTIKVPLDAIGDPDYILASVRTTMPNSITVDDTAWRVLEIKKPKNKKEGV